MRSPTRRAVLTGLAWSALVVLGVGGGYSLADLADGEDTAPPAAASEHSGHGGHVVPGAPSTPGSHSLDHGQSLDHGHSAPSAEPSMDTGGGEHGGEGHDAGGHGADGAAPADRPRAAVLGAFGLVNGGVLVAAGVLRRRSRTRRQAPAR